MAPVVVGVGLSGIVNGVSDSSSVLPGESRLEKSFWHGEETEDAEQPVSKGVGAPCRFMSTKFSMSSCWAVGGLWWLSVGWG